MNNQTYWFRSSPLPCMVDRCSSKSHQCCYKFHQTDRGWPKSHIHWCLQKQKTMYKSFFDISLSTFILNQEYRSFTCWWCKTYQYHNEHLSILLDRYNWRFRCDCHMWHHSCKDFCPLHTHYNLQHMQVICTLRGKLPKLSMLLVKKNINKVDKHRKFKSMKIMFWDSAQELLNTMYFSKF